MGMQTLCESEDPDAHLCSRGEINSAFNTGLKFNITGDTWLDSTYGNDWRDANCYGWTDDQTLISGLQGTDITADAGGNFGDKDCFVSLPIACCKRIP
jgi:hypothetical protein